MGGEKDNGCKLLCDGKILHTAVMVRESVRGVKGWLADTVSLIQSTFSKDQILQYTGFDSSPIQVDVNQDYVGINKKNCIHGFLD